MADVMYFSGVLDDNGEIHLTKVERVADVKVPQRVSPTISKPNSIPVTDPTLTAFHEPKADEPQCQGDG